MFWCFLVFSIVIFINFIGWHPKVLLNMRKLLRDFGGSPLPRQPTFSRRCPDPSDSGGVVGSLGGSHQHWNLLQFYARARLSNTTTLWRLDAPVKSKAYLVSDLSWQRSGLYLLHLQITLSRTEYQVQSVPPMHMARYYLVSPILSWQPGYSALGYPVWIWPGCSSPPESPICTISPSFNQVFIIHAQFFI